MIDIASEVVRAARQRRDKCFAWPRIFPAWLNDFYFAEERALGLESNAVRRILNTAMARCVRPHQLVVCDCELGICPKAMNEINLPLIWAKANDAELGTVFRSVRILYRRVIDA
jgi:hypothetical protein